MMPERFPDRADAGRTLAELLGAYRRRADVIVLALPRGGVPVAYEIARALEVPLDVFVVRKLGVPGHEELAMGALASGNVRILNDDVIAKLRIRPAEIEHVTIAEGRELARREERYRGDRPFPDLRGRTVILVDDGLATGASMRVAIAALRAEGPASVVVAVPVGAPEVCASLRILADDVVCAVAPSRFEAVGLWYDDFAQTTDDEVHDLLARSTPITARS